MKRILTSLSALLLLSACMEDPAPGEIIKTNFKGFDATYHCMDWKGVERCYYVVPPKEKPKHLIVALHPAFTPVRITESMSRLAAVAVPRGYLVVYPEGIDKQWNDGRVMTDVQTYRDKTDDVGFIDAVTASVQKQYGLDARRTTVAGMSNGGMMSLRLACQSERYGTVATVVANLPKGLRDACSTKAKKMLMVFGTDDTVVDYGGGVLAYSGIPTTWGEVESAEDTIAFFAKRNGCKSAPKETVLADAAIDRTRAVVDEYACRAPLTAVRVEKMGHTWPGERSRVIAWMTTRGAVTQQFNAADTILDFIER